MGDCCRVSSVVDLHHVDANQDSTYHPDADLGSDVYSMRIRMKIRIFFMRILIRLSTLVRIRIQILGSK
jgi:hypothetical protein